MAQRKRQSKAELGQKPLERNMNRNRNAKALATYLMMWGKSRDEILEQIMESHGYSEEMADKIYKNAEGRMAKKISNMAQQVSQKHYDMLTAIAEETYDDRRFDLTIKAIDLMNKTKNVYAQTVKLEGDSIKVKFDN